MSIVSHQNDEIQSAEQFQDEDESSNDQAVTDFAQMKTFSTRKTRRIPRNVQQSN
jgi:hypothetical protein